MMISYLLAVGLLAAGGVPVELTPLSGPVQHGELAGFDDAAVLLQREGEIDRVPLLGLSQLRTRQPAAAAGQSPSVWIRLVDGSQLQATEYRVADRRAAIELTSGRAVEIRTRDIAHVRFRDHGDSPALAQDWRQLAAQRFAGDVIVIRRQESLDHLEGVVLDVSADTVAFDFEGERIDVNRQRLDGLIYYQALDRQLPERLGQVVEVSGSRWNARSLELVDGALRLQTPAGVAHALPANQLHTLDFSAANTVWLSELEPESVAWTPYVHSRLPPSRVDAWFQPRRDQGLSGRPLVIDGIVYERGLAMTSRTEIVYRLTDEFRSFQAVAGIDDHVRPGGNVDLTISGDDRVLFQETLTGNEPAVSLQLDISGVRRLRLLVDFGQAMDIADHLNLGDARITK